MTYDVFPLDASPERAEILSHIMDLISATENVFADYTGTCAEGCLDKKLSFVDMCPACKERRRVIARSITAPNTATWEVWRVDADPEIVGVISFTDITHDDAKGHYIFFDHRLADKTPIIKNLMGFMFDSVGVSRLTIEIPRPFAALAQHAQKHLGFGGPFKFTLPRRDRRPVVLQVEGVKRGAIRWKGDMHDLLILGLVRPNTPIESPSLELSQAKSD